MGRKNLLSGLMGDANLDIGNVVEPLAPPLPRRTSNGAIGAVSRAIAEIRARSEIEIDPALIHDDGFRDRLSIDEADVAELRENIRARGQRVPILVRPHPERTGEYRVVYGRRRLAAIRSLGVPARALVQELTDEEAVLAQGQENSARRDPSFIEKALFAAQLREANYASALIQDALVIDKAILSRMKSVTDSVPQALITAIGAAPNSGRRRWEELAELVREIGPVDLLDVAFSRPPAPDSTSDDRLALAVRNIARERQVVRGQHSAGGETAITLSSGRALGHVKSSARSIEVKLSRKAAPEFAAWIERDPAGALGLLYEVWSKESGSS